MKKTSEFNSTEIVGMLNLIKANAVEIKNPFNEGEYGTIIKTIHAESIIFAIDCAIKKLGGKV